MSCSRAQVMGRTVTLLGLLAGGRGPIPAPSAIAGVVSRVGSLERSVEFHEQAILELERQVSEVERLVYHVDLLEKLVVQLQDTTSQTRDRSLTIAELGMKLETKVLDLSGPLWRRHSCRWPNFTMIWRRRYSMLNSRWTAELRTLSSGAMTLAESVNVGVNTVEGRVTHLEQWGSDITASFNAVEGRVDNLEQWGEELAASL